MLNIGSYTYKTYFVLYFNQVEVRTSEKCLRYINVTIRMKYNKKRKHVMKNKIEVAKKCRHEDVNKSANKNVPQFVKKLNLFTHY